MVQYSKHPQRAVVFAASPIGRGGFVAALRAPGRNATGFHSAEYGMSAKWLELLKTSPARARAAVLYDAGNPGGLPQFAAVQTVAATLGGGDTGELARRGRNRTRCHPFAQLRTAVLF